MLAMQPGAYVELRMRVGGRMGLQEMANVNLCTCGEIITDYHNHIWLWRDIDFRPALFFMHVSKPIPSWLAGVHCVIVPGFRIFEPREKSAFNK